MINKRGGMISKKPQLEKERSELQGILNFIGIDLLATKEKNLLDSPWKKLPEKIREEIIIPADPIRYFRTMGRLRSIN